MRRGTRAPRRRRFGAERGPAGRRASRARGRPRPGWPTPPHARARVGSRARGGNGPLHTVPRTTPTGHGRMQAPAPAPRTPRARRTPGRPALPLRHADTARPEGSARRRCRPGPGPEGRRATLGPVCCRSRGGRPPRRPRSGQAPRQRARRPATTPRPARHGAGEDGSWSRKGPSFSSLKQRRVSHTLREPPISTGWFGLAAQQPRSTSFIFSVAENGKSVDRGRRSAMPPFSGVVFPPACRALGNQGRPAGAWQ